MNREVNEIPPNRQDGDVLIIPVVEEVTVVVKRLVLREEISLQLIDQDEAIELRAPSAFSTPLSRGLRRWLQRQTAT